MASSYLNKKQELFAQFVAGGETYSRAYELAGYEPSTANASALANKEIVKKRIEELRQDYERKEAEFRLLREQAEKADPEFAGEIQKGIEWNLQRVLDLMGENIRLAQIAGEYKAANEGLKMLGEALGMFTEAKAAAAEKNNTTNNFLALAGEAAAMIGAASAPSEDTDDSNPLRPRAAKKKTDK